MSAITKAMIEEGKACVAAHEMGYVAGAEDMREACAKLFDEEADELVAYLSTLPKESKIALQVIADLRAYALRIRAVEIESEEAPGEAVSP